MMDLILQQLDAPVETIPWLTTSPRDEYISNSPTSRGGSQRKKARGYAYFRRGCQPRTRTDLLGSGMASLRGGYRRPSDDGELLVRKALLFVAGRRIYNRRYRGLITTYGAFLPYYQDHLLPDTDDFLLSLIGSTQSFLVLLFSGIVGRLLDAGFHRSIAITGSSLLTVGTLTLSWTSGSGRQGEGNYGLIWLTSAFIAGLGEACFFVFSSQNAAAWFPRSKSPAVGFTSSGAALGESSD